MDGELLEVWKIHSAAMCRIKARILRPRKRPLDNRVRNMKTLRKRPIAPGPVVGEQSAENVDI
jgi:hypothetical protein